MTINAKAQLPRWAELVREKYLAGEASTFVLFRNVFDIFLVNLDPTVGSEIRKSRPCVVVSPDELNRHIRTVVVAPMTGAQRASSR